MKTKGKIEIIIFRMYFVLSPFCVNCKRLCLSLTDQMKKKFSILLFERSPTSRHCHCVGNPERANLQTNLRVMSN